MISVARRTTSLRDDLLDNRFVTASFITIQLIFLFFSAQSLVLHAMGGLTFLCSLWTALRGRWLFRAYQGAVLIGIAITFGLWALLGHPHSQRSMPEIYAFVAQFFIIVQSTELSRSPVRHSTANYIPGLGCLAMMLIFLSYDGQLSVSLEGWFSFGFMAMLFFVLRPDLMQMLVQTRFRDWRKAGTILFIAIAALSAGFLFQRDVEANLQNLQRRLPGLRAVRGQSRFGLADANFVTDVDLESVTAAQKQNPNSPVFTADSSSCPGYMRTLAFDQFDGWRWSNTPRRPRDANRAMRPLPRAPVIEGRRVQGNQSGRYFALASNPKAPLRQIVVHRPPGNGKLAPLPFNAAYIQADADYLSADAHGTIVFGLGRLDSFAVYSAARKPQRLRPTYRPSLLQLPGQDVVAFRQWATRVCGDADSPRLIAQRIEAYFQSEHGYSLDYAPHTSVAQKTQIAPATESRIIRFLEDRAAAHCEYFATATVMLLRAQGIPCRLATGYLVYELNDSQDYFIARNRNAHAWVEAYDADQEEWFVVESTPGVNDYVNQFRDVSLEDGPTAEDAASTGNGTNYSWQLLERFFSKLFEFLSNWWLVGLSLVALAWLIYRRRQMQQRRQSQHPAAPLLRRADRLAAKYGYCRAASETCHQFAARLATATTEVGPLASWYSHYGDQRYRLTSETCLPPPTRRELQQGHSQDVNKDVASVTSD